MSPPPQELEQKKTRDAQSVLTEAQGQRMLTGTLDPEKMTMADHFANARVEAKEVSAYTRIAPP